MVGGKLVCLDFQFPLSQRSVSPAAGEAFNKLSGAVPVSFVSDGVDPEVPFFCFHDLTGKQPLNW